MNLILYAVPVFFSLILIELCLERLKGTDYYRVNDALTSLATGTINQLVSVSSRLIPFTFYALLYQHIALWDIGDSVWVWVLAFVIYDFFYYWNHRFGHEMNILWAAHVVHHSSEEYNLTTALRQTGTGLLSFVFYLPMAVMGFDPLIVLSVGALNLIYQFWVHTRHVGKLGWIEWIFVTPSNHRGHHAQNAVYIDRNYGGVFIVWDRLFGSYQEELDEDPPVFGIRGAVQSWNPIWVNFQIYHQLASDAIRTKSWWHKLTLWFRRTGWRPPDVERSHPINKTDLADFRKYQTDVPGPLKLYCLLHYIINSVVALGFAIYVADLSINERILMVSFIVLTCFSIGALMEGRHYAGVLEWVRVASFMIVIALSPVTNAASLILCIACLVGLPLLILGRRASIQQGANVNPKKVLSD